MDIDNNNISNNENINNTNNNNTNNNIINNNQEILNNFNNELIRILEGGIHHNDFHGFNRNEEVKILNKNLKDIEQISLKQDITFINNIKEIFPNSDIDNNINENIEYTKENFLKSLNYIYNILEKCNISYKKINDIRKMNIKYRIKAFEEKNDIFPYIEELIKLIKENKERKK